MDSCGWRRAKQASSPGVLRDLAGPVLCVLSPELCGEYASDLDLLVRCGVEVHFQSSAEQALSKLQEISPRLVIVGTEIGWMDGIEFLGILSKRFPWFDKPVVVLPNKTDPFLPIIHVRDPTTGHSQVEELEFQQIVIAIEKPHTPEPEVVEDRSTRKTTQTLAVSSLPEPARGGRRRR